MTMSVALGDIDGDKDLDLVLGNTGTSSRLYKNDGKGHFGSGINVTPADRTQQVVLADVNGDKRLDLLTANLGGPNKVFLNNGVGGFGAGTNIGAQTDFTTSLAVGDVDRDGRRDVIAGNNRPSLGAAGSVSDWHFDHIVDAHVNDGASITTDQSLLITAADRTDVAAIGRGGVGQPCRRRAFGRRDHHQPQRHCGDRRRGRPGARAGERGLPLATGVIVSAAS